MAVAVSFGESGGGAELRGSDASAKDGGADGEEAGLFLRDDAEMVAMDVLGDLFLFGGIESVAEDGLDGGEEGFGGVAVFEEEEFEAGFVAGLAEDGGAAEEFGDGAGDGEDLFPADEGV